MNSTEALSNAYQLMSSLDEKLNGLTIKGGDDSKASAALLHLSLEHFGAIVVLLQNRLDASAAALLRVQYEALIRGMYFYQCASENEAKKFFAGDEPPRVKVMIEKLEKMPGFTSGTLSLVHLREWGTMNSFTHGGAEQVQRRYSGADLANHYSEENRLAIIKAAKGMSQMAVTHAALSFGSLELVKEIKEAFASNAGEPYQSGQAK